MDIMHLKTAGRALYDKVCREPAVEQIVHAHDVQLYHVLLFLVVVGSLLVACRMLL